VGERPKCLAMKTIAPRLLSIAENLVVDHAFFQNLFS
jgi:hypothetical protein